MSLYLGTDPSNYSHLQDLIHYPVIKTVPLPIPQHLWDDFADYTHILFTSKNAVAIFFEQLKQPLEGKQIIAIGTATAAKLAEYGCTANFVADDESQEGVIELLNQQDLTHAYIFYPRSSIARKNLEHFLMRRHVRHQVCDLYDTHLQKPEPVPDLSKVQEIIFTSPSTVKGFLAAFGALPKDKKLTCIGAITEAELNKSFPI
jgi:uroporphyrinogen-III synthase